MRIGIFDSGLGGLIITRAIIKKLPQYDYVYLGDTKRVPYGNRPQKEILKFTKQALTFLFAQGCRLVIIACNTSSAKALRKIQREFLPKSYPQKKVLGVIVPTAEAVFKSSKTVGVLSTSSTAKSHAYKRELKKIHPKAKVYEQAALKLVPLIEANRLLQADAVLRQYLKPLLKHNIDSLVLGCTHYPILKSRIKKIAGKKIKIFSQDDIIPGKLENYLKRHPEIEKVIGKHHKRVFEVTGKNTNFDSVAKTLFGKKLNFKLVTY